MYICSMNSIYIYSVVDISSFLSPAPCKLYTYSEKTTLTVYIFREDDIFLLLDADELPTREALIFLKEIKPLIYVDI